MLRQQLLIVATSAIETVYYTTIGSETMQPTIQQACVEFGLQCHHLAHHGPRLRGETLRHVHEFCQANAPSQRVIFLSNLVPAHVTVQNLERLLRHLTMAATSEQCQQSLNNPNTCNVCGLAFYTMPAFLWPGNMFATSCGYVNQLLPPVQFEERMREFIAKTMIAYIFTKLQFHVLDLNIERLGLDGYSMDHWVGSHPDLRPCDVSNQPLAFWSTQDRGGSDFQVSSTGARPKDGTPFGSPTFRLMKVREDESLRIREFHFLPGNLLKWYTLYNKAPPESSWVWSYFPDGERWLNGVKQHGSRAIDIVTDAYTNSGTLK